MIPVLTGFAAGGLHVFSGPDHLAALAPIALRNPVEAGKTGAFWGLGHGAGVLLVAALGLLLRGFVDVEAWAEWAEFVVGFLLLGVGGWALWRASNIEIHVHAHDHEGSPHEHVHSHGEKGHRHGVAGSGHLFGVLPALALPLEQAVIYLIAYLVAAVAAMGGFAYALGALARRGGIGWVRGLMYASGGLAVVVGVFWIGASWPF